MTSEIFVEALAAYVPENEGDVPPLAYLPSLFKRRLSQMTKMTIEAVHDLLEAVPETDKAHTKMVFGSYRGELSYAFKVNNQYAEDYTVMPATFTLSVHNAAIAEATIAFGLTGGYATVFPAEGDFHSALQAAAAPVLSGDEKQVIFAFGDEHIPAPYREVPLAGSSSQDKPAFAFAALLRSKDGAPTGASTADRQQAKALDIQAFKGKSAMDFMQAYR